MHLTPRKRFVNNLVIALFGVSGLSLYDLGESHATPPPPINLRLAIDYENGIFAEDDMAAFGVAEWQQGEDLNNDGDANDSILHIYDSTTGQVTRTPYELVRAEYRPMCKEGNHLAFIAAEGDNFDFNGDNDQLDSALVVWDLQTGNSTVNPQAAGKGVACGGEHVAFRADENGDNTDYNGDGDQEDDVWHVFDITTEREKNLELAPKADMHASAKMNEDALIFTAHEISNSRDLDADGDISDIVFFHYGLSSQITSRYKLAGYIPIDEQRHDTRPPGRFIPIQVPEAWQGPLGKDLNGDGDEIDNVVFVIDSRDGKIYETDKAGFTSRSASRWVTLFVEETGQNQDINGDGDQEDTILIFRHVFTGMERNSGLAVTGRPGDAPRLSSDFGSGFSDHLVAAEITEAGSHLDLNGDGQMDSRVVLVYDPNLNNRKVIDEKSLCDFGFEQTLVLGKTHALTCVRESLAPSGDLNGDGDTDDWIAGSIRLDGSGNVLTGVAMGMFAPPRTIGELGYFVAWELSHEQDLNNTDDITSDAYILQAYDLDTGSVHNHAIALTNNDAVNYDPKLIWAQNDRALFFSANESIDLQDYNGDGDTSDHVLHVLR